MPDQIQPDKCCDSSCDFTITTQVPGPAGAAGAAGAAGTNGTNAYSVTTAGFTVPAVSSNVTVDVPSTWMVGTQVVYIATAGYYEVQSKPSATQAILKNLGYTGNAVPTTVIASGVQITPSGLQGPDGALTGAAGGDLTGTYPNPQVNVPTTKGTIRAGNGTVPANLGVGADGAVLHSDSGEVTGLIHRAIDLSGVNTSIGGATPIANGGTGQTTANAAMGALSPLTTKGDVLGYSTVNARLPVGTNGHILTADSAQTLGIKWAAPAAATHQTSVVAISVASNPTTPTEPDTTYHCTVAGAGYALTLNPATEYFDAGNSDSKLISVKNLALSANNVTVTPDGSETIDGAATLVLTPGQSTTLYTDGSNWFVR